MAENKARESIIAQKEEPVNTVYRRILETVNATQWFPGVKIPNVTYTGDDKGVLNIPEGAVIILPGDWIVTDPVHRQRKYKDIEFKAYFEEVESASMDDSKSPA